ncbi:MAG TPA: protein-disulfide reductase DsbD domain-containing protein [Vicinamibacterales bacterium]|nr:protein-disulfide reductase DsbD domain-containing protein [Vicinamibacterales bacterium]
MRSIVLGLIAIVVASGGSTFARATVDKQQTPKPTDPNEITARYLKLRLGQSGATAAPGGRIALSVDVTPAAKIHVYAPGQIGAIAVKLQTSADLKATPARYPPSVSYFFAPTSETFKVYNKPFQITQDITLANTAKMRQRAAAKDTLVIPGTLEYQACDDLVCYRPDSVAVSWKVELTPAAR